MMNKSAHLRRLIKNLHDYRFRSRILRNFIVVLLLVTSLCLTISAVYSNNLLNAAQWVVDENNMFTLQRSADMIDNIMLELRGLAHVLSINDSVRSLTITPNHLPYYSDRLEPVTETLDLLHGTFDYLDSILIYSELNNIVINQTGNRTLQSQDQIWYSRYESLTRRQTEVFFQRKNGVYPYWITIACAIHSAQGTRLGAVILNINIQNLGKLIGDSTAHGQSLFLVNEDNQLYYSSNFSLIGSYDYAPETLDFLRGRRGEFSERIEINGESYVVSCMDSSLELWRYVFVSPTAIQQEKTDIFFTLSRNAILLIIPLTIAVVFFLTQRISRPLNSIMSALEDEPKPLGEAIPQDCDEVEHIIRTVNKTRKENSLMHSDLADRVEELRNEQLRMLQSQIDPHFLYNALDAIRWMSILQHGGESELSDMTATLASLLRTSLKYDSYLVELSEELEHVRMYLQIYEHRYKGRIHVEYDVPEDLLNARVIKLSIQPLIENALKHGLRSKRYRGTLKISAAHISDAIAVSVEDDGVGMTEQQITILNEEMRRERAAEGQHIGLLNVNRRIKLIFGSDYGLVLSRRSGGVTVTMVLPLTFSLSEKSL